MVASALFLIASLFAFARADAPYPIAPVKSVYKSGTSCHIQWLKGSSGWGGMTIELMTGSNTNMISLGTVATGKDGSQDGSFDHPCPEVTINAPIYFYRFTAKGETPNYTARFTIASSSGHTDPAPNQTQPPPDNTNTPWGVGAIKPGPGSASGNSTNPVSTPSGSVSGSSTSTVSTSSSSASGSSTSPVGTIGGGRSTTLPITPTPTPTTVVVPTTRIITYVATKTFHDDPDKTRVLTKTLTVTDKLTSVVSPTETAKVTVTTTVWIRPTTTTVYSVSTATKFTTSYVSNYVTVTQSPSTTQTVSSVSTVTVNSAGTTVTGDANRSANGKKSAASRRAEFPIMHILAFVVGSAATCITLLS